MSASGSKSSSIRNLDISKALAAFAADPDAVFQSLQQKNDAEVRKLEDGGVEIILKPDRSTIWIILAICLGSSILLTLMGLSEDLNWIDWEFRFQTMKLYVFAGMGALGCCFALVVRFASGPPKATLFQVHPGRLDIDYYIAGDHIVKKIYADDIKNIHVAGGLNIVLRTTAIAIAPFGNEKTLELIRQLIAVTLWPKTS